MDLNTAINVAADWWTEKIARVLGEGVVQVRRHKKKRINKKWAKRYGFRLRHDKAALREVLEKNIREYVDSNRDKLTYSQLTIGASGYRKDLDNIVTESVAEIGIKDFVLPRCANLVLVQWYGHPGVYSVWAYENDMDNPDYKKTLLDVE